MEIIFRRMAGRLKSERGSVGVVVALVIFLVMGMLTMTWNTAQLSKAKMRLQNAADSAALAHAVWQARGMNAVQNINDEMYEALGLALKLRTIGAVTEGVAMGLEALSAVPVIGAIFKGLAIAAHCIGVLTGGTAGWISARICKLFLKNIAMVYAKGSSLLGLWNAQQLAAQNEAGLLAKLDGTKSTADSDSWHFGIYALWMSWPIKDSFMLPLAESGKTDGSPWKAEECNSFKISVAPWLQIYDFCGSSEGWDIRPYVSKRGDQEGLKLKDGKVEKDGDEVLPGPTLWVAFKLDKDIQTLPLDGFLKSEKAKTEETGRWTHKLPMFAVAAAQCVTGDVIPHSRKTEENKTNQRPAGFGAGATAKLVPVGDVFSSMNTVVGGVVNAVIYH